MVMEIFLIPFNKGRVKKNFVFKTEIGHTLFVNQCDAFRDAKLIWQSYFVSSGIFLG